MTSGPQTGSEGTPETAAPPTEPRPEGAAPEATDGVASEDGATGEQAAAPEAPAPESPVADDAGPDAAEAQAPGDASDGAAEQEGGAGDDEPTLEQRLAAAEALSDEHWNGRLRLQAELENQRKRALRDVQNARKFGLEPLLNDLLPVVDSIEMGLQASVAENATVQSIREGNELTLKMFATMLDKHGIAEVNPVGEKFDPAFHQAMSMQAVEGAAPNTVVQVLQKGYTLNERLMRPALVMVAK